MVIMQFFQVFQSMVLQDNHQKYKGASFANQKMMHELCQKLLMFAVF